MALDDLIEKHPKSSKLVDIIGFDLKQISEGIFKGSGNLKKNAAETFYAIGLGEPLARTYNWCKDTVLNAEDANKAFMIGYLVSTGVNAIVTSIVSESTTSQYVIDKASFWSEWISNNITVGTVLYYYKRHDKGLSVGNSLWKLAKVAAVGTAVSFLPYQHGRDWISYKLRDQGFVPFAAKTIAQGIGILTIYIPLMDVIGRPMKYIEMVKKLPEFTNGKMQEFREWRQNRSIDE
jgi:hypothetical protein